MKYIIFYLNFHTFYRNQKTIFTNKLKNFEFKNKNSYFSLFINLNFKCQVFILYRQKYIKYAGFAGFSLKINEN